jgi:hypothetical protein
MVAKLVTARNLVAYSSRDPTPFPLTPPRVSRRPAPSPPPSPLPPGKARVAPSAGEGGGVRRAASAIALVDTGQLRRRALDELGPG